MPKWNLSESDAKAREAAFEAKVLAELAAATPQPSSVKTPTAPVADGIQISLTTAGQTTRYDKLDAVPLPLRQRIMNAWLSAPGTSAPPVIRAESSATPAPRSRSRRTAVAINLFLPGAGQLYFGQPGWGAVYALSFIACTVPMIGIIGRAMHTAMSGDILEEGKLEKIGELLRPGLLGTLGTLQIIIITASIIHLFRSRPRV